MCRRQLAVGAPHAASSAHYARRVRATGATEQRRGAKCWLRLGSSRHRLDGGLRPLLRGKEPPDAVNVGKPRSRREFPSPCQTACTLAPQRLHSRAAARLSISTASGPSWSGPGRRRLPGWCSTRDRRPPLQLAPALPFLWRSFLPVRNPVRGTSRWRFSSGRLCSTAGRTMVGSAAPLLAAAGPAGTRLWHGTAVLPATRCTGR